MLDWSIHKLFYLTFAFLFCAGIGLAVARIGEPTLAATAFILALAAGGGAVGAYFDEEAEARALDA